MLWLLYSLSLSPSRALSPSAIFSTHPPTLHSIHSVLWLVFRFSSESGIDDARSGGFQIYRSRSVWPNAVFRLFSSLDFGPSRTEVTWPRPKAENLPPNLRTRISQLTTKSNSLDILNINIKSLRLRLRFSFSASLTTVRDPYKADSHFPSLNLAES